MSIKTTLTNAHPDAVAALTPPVVLTVLSQPGAPGPPGPAGSGLSADITAGLTAANAMSGANPAATINDLATKLTKQQAIKWAIVFGG